MFYQEKKTITSIISGLLVLALYSVYGILKYMERGENLLNDLSFWATAMLTAIGGGIIVIIIIQIVFHIVLAIAQEVSKEVSKNSNGKVPEEAYERFEVAEVEDEMDRLIALKSLRNSTFIIGMGFITALVSLYIKMPPAIMLNIIFISFQLGALFEGFSQLYFYRRGVQNG